MRLSPTVSIALGARTKNAGDRMVGRPVELYVRNNYPEEMSAYERLLGDAMDGEAMLFARQDAVEAAWRVVDPCFRAAIRRMSMNPARGARPRQICCLPADIGTTRVRPRASVTNH